MDISISTIQKSFRKVFPKEKWDQLTSPLTDDINDFEGFDESDFQHRPTSDNVGSHMGDAGGQIINALFQSDIDDIVRLLNTCQDDVLFHRDHVVEDVLLNPGPADQSIENIMEEVLQVQDVSCSGEDMDEVESADELPVQQDTIRPIIYKALKTLSNLRNNHI